nr:ribonuclease H-like domain-containing protein [uncultured Bacillus sp.]
MSIKNKLNRLKPHLSASNPVDKEKKNLKVIADESAETLPYAEIWRQNGVRPYYTDQDYCLVREVSYPLDRKHGNYDYSDFRKAVAAWNESGLHHPLSAAGHKAEELFFFDTETTGLGGGVGNTIFLLGQASISENEVRLKQHILPRPGSEVPLYKSFLESIDYSKMVTYNGKAFDWPVVKTRHTLIRDHVPKLPPFGHFDLYHAARRLWKHRLERLKLSVVEKEILGFEREGDIPGYLAPMIYFDYIESKNPQGMLGILKHNEWDILSLITLYTHLSFQLLGLDGSRTSQETFEVGRWYSYIGESATAERVFSELSKGNEIESIRARHALAFQAKKKKDWEQAAKLWKSVAEQGEGYLQYEACIELAKIFEHRLKQYNLALRYAEQAKSIEITAKQEELAKRICRLLRKLEKH